MASTRGQLVGNRIALLGTALYFCEWIAIAFIPNVPTDKLGVDPAAIVAEYTHPQRIAFAAGWFSFFLFGRVVFCAALRNAFYGMRRELLFADICIVAMGASVILEVGSFALAATAGWLVQAHGTADGIVALDAAGSTGFAMLWGPLAMSVLAGSLAMLLSGLFPKWLSWLGVVAGGLLAVGSTMGAASLGSSGTLHDVGGALTSLPVPFIWIWMIATSVILFRATPRHGALEAQVTTSS
jgi:hypothetical protein